VAALEVLATRSLSNGIVLAELSHGLLVRQGDESYVARNWRLSPSVEELIETALAAGLGCMIREDHPRRNSRWPNMRGVVYLAFSPDNTGQWSLAIDTANPKTGNFGSGVFNGKYHEQFVAAGIPFKFEGRNKTAGHLVVQRDLVVPTLRSLGTFDHSVLAMNRAKHDGLGFTTEYVIQRSLMLGWADTPWGGRYQLIQDEFPVDGGLTSRRIDILARDRRTGDWLIVELKRAEASVAAVRQVEDYLLALGRRDDFAQGALRGVLVAERIPTVVREFAARSGVELYEIEWPLTLKRA
jgi:hypothetical protein